MRFQAPRGTEDVLPGQSERWLWLEETFRKVCELYDYHEIRTPTFEDTQLFHRLGDGSDVVSKEMYTFTDRGDRSLTLKPEGTAPAVRAYIENSVGAPGQITRLSYITPIFRYDRPQKGRLRESHQTGVELIGSSSASADAEVIGLTARYYRELGLGASVVKLNSLGGRECRARYTDALLDFAKPLLVEATSEFRDKCLKNPLRLLDSKDHVIQAALAEAPTIDGFLEDDSKRHFADLVAELDAVGVAYERAPRLVRGLDYYTRTVFEVHSDALGAQSSLCGGGRYDDLIEECGGPPTPAVGVAMGIERALIALDELGQQAQLNRGAAVFAICLTSDRQAFARIIDDMRSANISVVSDPDARSAKSQFRQADKAGAKLAVVIGDDELASQVATIKNLVDAVETKVAIGNLAETIRDTVLS